MMSTKTANNQDGSTYHKAKKKFNRKVKKAEGGLEGALARAAQKVQKRAAMKQNKELSRAKKAFSKHVADYKGRSLTLSHRRS